MSIIRWITKLKDDLRSRRSGKGRTVRHKPRSVPLLCEALEDRFLPAGGLADLTVVGGTLGPAQAVVGDPLPVSWTVTNSGTGPANASWEDAVYVSSSAIFNSANATLLATVPAPATLAAGASYTNSTNVKLPSMLAGPETLFFVANSNQDQSESNYDNNVSAESITVLGGPDLKIQATAPSTAIAGNSVSFAVSWTVTNASTFDAPAQWFDNVYVEPAGNSDPSNVVSLGSFAEPVGGPLDAGASYTAYQNLTLPSMPAGNYDLIFTTDQSASGSANPQAVTDLADASTSVPITVSEPNVDLVMTNATVSSPLVVGDNGPVSVSWTVQNNGSDPANNSWSDAIYLSTSQELDSSATLLTTMPAHQGPLGPGQSYTFSFSGNGFPNTPTGTMYILFEADYDNTQGEINPTNSVFPVKVLLTSPGDVDLGVTATAPAQATVGGNIPVQWTVTNSGAAAANGQWQDSVYLSNQPSVNASSILLDSQQNQEPLAPGASYTQTDNVNLPTIPVNQLGTGSYYIVVVTNADNGQAVSPTDTDLTASSAIQLSYPNVDLTVTSPSAPTTATAGSSIQLSYTVENKGSDPTTNSNWTDAVYLSTSPTVNPYATLLGTFNSVYGLGANASYTENPSVTLPATASGNLYLVFVADQNGAALEPDTSNDFAAVPITVTGQDVAVTLASVGSGSGVPVLPLGASVNVSWQVTNNGAGSVAPNWDDAVYLSDTPAFDPSTAILVQSFDESGQSPLSPNGYYTETPTVTLPSTTPGSRYLLFMTDLPVPTSGSPLEPPAGTQAVPVPIMLGAPDLAVSDVSGPASAVLNSSVTVGWTVTNVGTAPALAAGWSDAVYLSSQSTFDGSARLLATVLYTNSNGLAAQGFYQVSTSVPIPNSATGQQYLLIVANNGMVDGQFSGQVESNLGNNVTSIGIDLTAPNVQLGLSSPSVAQTTVNSGNPVDVSWTVTNTGTDSAGGPWYDEVYLSTSNTFDGSAQLLGKVANLSPLGPNGASYTQSNVPINVNAPPGSYNLFIVADGDQGQSELSTTGTVSAPIPLTVTAPDLKVITATAQSSAGIGTSIAVSWTVKNLGADLTAGSWTDAVYLSRTGSSNNGAYNLAQFSEGNNPNQVPLSTDGTYQVNETITLPSWIGPGTYYLVFVANANGSFGQNNQNENSFPLEITLVEPDLTFSGNVTAPSSGGINDTISVAFNVENTGGAIPDTSSWQDAVYLSTTSTVNFNNGGGSNPQPYQLYTFNQNGPLATDGTYQDSASNITLPGWITPGSGYYLVFVTDSFSQLAQNGAASNQTYVPFTLAIPDLTINSVTGPEGPVDPNASFPVTWNVEDTGAAVPANAGSWNDAVYLSRSETLSFTDGSLVATLWQGNESGSGTYQGNATVNLNNVSPGSYYLLFATDVGNMLSGPGGTGSGDVAWLQITVAQPQVGGGPTQPVIPSGNVPSIVITDTGGPFDGLAFPATAAIAGTTDADDTPGPSLEGVPLTVSYYSGPNSNDPALGEAPTSAGTYTAVAYFPGSNDYSSASSSVTFTIGQTDAILDVSDRGGRYNGSPFPAVVGVAGIDGGFSTSLENVSPSVSYYSGNTISGPSLPGAPTSPGTYTVVASFSGSADYQGGLAATTFTIRLGKPSVQVSASGGTYTGSAFPVTATVSGAGQGPASTLENQSLTLTYFTTGGASLSGAPVDVGTYTVVASFLGSTDFGSASAATTFTISPASASVQVNDAGGTFTGQPFAATATVEGIHSGFGPSLEGQTPTLTYYAGSGVGGTALGGVPMSFGTYTVLASFPGSSDYGSATSSATFTISKATPTLAVSDAGGSFDGSAFPANVSLAGVGGAAGASLEEQSPTLTYYSGTSPLAGAPTSAGSYTVVGSFGGSLDYASAASSATFTIGKAAPTILLGAFGGTYNGSPFTASAFIAGAVGGFGSALESSGLTLTYFSGTAAGGTPLGGSPTSAGTYSVVASFPGSADYGSASATATFTIKPASPTVQVTDNGGVFNGSAFPASALVEGISGGFAASLEGHTPALTYYSGSGASGNSLGQVPTSAGTYTVVAVFPAAADYGSASAATTFSITPTPPATVEVSVAGGTFDGSTFAATALVEGAQGGFGSALEGVAPTLSYYSGSAASGNPLLAAPGSVGTYTVVAFFKGSADYSSASSAATFAITPAPATLTVNDGGGTFNGLIFPASVAVKGIQGSFGSALEGIIPTLTYYSGANVLTGAPADAGIYTVVASFSGSADYSPASSSTTFTISPATPTITVSDSGGIYTGSSFAASATITGVGGSGATLESNGPTFTYYSGSSASGQGTSLAPVTAGTYTVAAAFPGSSDYTGAVSTPVTFTIAQATPTISFSSMMILGSMGNMTYDGQPVVPTATVSGVTLSANGQTSSSLESASPTLTFYSGSALLPAAPVNPGTYSVVASFAGTQDFAAASKSSTFTLNYYNGTSPTGSALDSVPIQPGTYTKDILTNSSEIDVTFSLTYFAGVNPQGTHLAPPVDVGTYTLSVVNEMANPAVTNNYTYTISQATPTVSVSDSGGVYNGQPMPASALVTGVNGTPAASLQSVSPALTYYSGSGVGGTSLTVPVAAGTYTVVASFPGSLDYTSAVSAPVTFTISPASPTVQVSDGGTFNGSTFSALATVKGISGSFGASLEGHTPGLTYYSGSSVGGTALGGAPVKVGTYTVVAFFAGSSDYGSAGSTATFTITPATPIVSISDASGTFHGSTFAASVTVQGAGGGGPGASLEGNMPTVTYHAGSGVSGTVLGGAPMSAGTYTVVASFPGSSDFGAASSSASFTISPPTPKATPTLTVSDAGGTYYGQTLPASFSIAGIGNPASTNLEGVSPTLTYFTGSSASGSGTSTAPSLAGTYTVRASFPGSVDFASASVFATFTITKATETVKVTDGGGTYTGQSFPATATVTGNGLTGASLEGVNATFKYFAGNSASGTALPSAPIMVGTYTVLASYAASQDFAGGNSSTTFAITRATPGVTVSDAGTYNGKAIPASALVAGVSGPAGASLEAVTPTLTYFAGSSASGSALTGAPVQAGIYTVRASFAGSPDYNSAASQATFTIARAAPTVKVVDNGGTYAGQSFGAVATVAGLSGAASATLEGFSASVAFFAGSSASGTALGGAPVHAGTYTAVASFPGSTDYASASAAVTFVIKQATSAVTVTDNGGTYSGGSFAALATVTGLGQTGASLESVSPTFAYYAGRSASGSPLSGGAPAQAGNYTVVATFPGSPDFAGASSTVSFVIARTAATLKVSDGGSYTGQPMSATATLTGVNNVASASLEGISPTFTYFSGTSALSGPPTKVGTYSVVASFAGSTDYNSATSSATFTITKANPTLAVSDSGGVFNGSAFPATFSILGLTGPAGTSLEGVTPTLTYYSGSSASGSALSGAPVAAGTYTVVASFAGSADYNSASSSAVTFTIKPLASTIS